MSKPTWDRVSFANGKPNHYFGDKSIKSTVPAASDSFNLTAKNDILHELLFNHSS